LGNVATAKVVQRQPGTPTLCEADAIIKTFAGIFQHIIYNPTKKELVDDINAVEIIFAGEISTYDEFSKVAAARMAELNILKAHVSRVIDVLVPEIISDMNRLVGTIKTPSTTLQY
jgi:hypothetical protein